MHDIMKPTCLLSVKDGDNESSCSGIIINYVNGYILSHASLISPIMSKNKNLFNKLQQSGNLPKKYFKHEQIETIVEYSNQTNKENTNGYITSLLNFVTSASRSNHSGMKLMSKIELVWKVEDFHQILESLFPKSNSWSFLDSSNQSQQKSFKNEIEAEIVAKLLPYFVLLKVDFPTKAEVQHLQIKHGENIQEGELVYAVGTPFGSLSPPVFLNSMSKGIICKTAGEKQCLLLTDARCIPGCEGGALFDGYSEKDRNLVGIVVAPLCWKSNEWVGMTIACSVDAVSDSLRNFNFTFDMQSYIPRNALLKNKRHISAATFPRVVLVQTATSWGTGVLLDRQGGLVLTCGHVVKSHGWIQVATDIGERKWFSAQRIYAVENQAAFDVALIRLEDFDIKSDLIGPLCISQQYEEGDAVSVIGHAVFGKEHALTASTCRGVISAVRKVHGMPVMVQSTCAVHAGASGGPLVSDNGHIVAMVTCNAKDTTNGATYPHVNLGIPMATIWPVIQNYIQTNDVTVLENLHVKDKIVQQLWKLQLKDFPINPPVQSKL